MDEVWTHPVSGSCCIAVGCTFFVGDGTCVAVGVFIPPVLPFTGIRVGEILVLLYARSGWRVGVAEGWGTSVGTRVTTGVSLLVGTGEGVNIAANAINVGAAVGTFVVVGTLVGPAVTVGVTVPVTDGSVVGVTAPKSFCKSIVLVYETAAAFVF